MKTRILTLLLLITVAFWMLPGEVGAVSTSGTSVKKGNIDLKIDQPATTSAKAPSMTFLESKKSQSASTNISAVADAKATFSSINARDQRWNIDFREGVGVETDGGGHNVGAPIGDATLPIALSLLLLYLIYRGVTTSKRKSDI